MTVSLLQAIAREEGWGDRHSRCRRNNNPGNIEAGRFADAHGAAGSDGRFAIFPSPEAGFGALRALLSGPAYHGLTVAAAVAKYAPSTENNTALYVEHVCLWTGCHPTDLASALVAVA